MKKNQVEGARKRSLASQMQRLLTQIVALPEYRWRILHNAYAHIARVYCIYAYICPSTGGTRSDICH